MRQRGFALVELLVVVAIIAVLAAAYIGFKGKGKGKTLPGQAIEKAESVECQSNLNQIRQMVQMDMADSGQPAPGLDQGATAAISRCPVGGQPYSYEPSSGRAWCTTPGHEKY